MRDEIVLVPSKKKQALMLLVATLFVLAGIFIVSKTDASDVWIGYVCIVFFGLGGVVFAAQLLPGSSFLKIRRDGFEFRALWRGTAFRWSDVQEFGVAEFTLYHGGIPQKHRMVGFRFSPSSARRDAHPRLHRLNQALVGYDAALPDNYGMKHDELASLLNQKKMEYAG
jgi:hypothetical protein